jgi:hypothetical protein
MMVVQPPKRVEHNKEKELSKWVIIDICAIYKTVGHYDTVLRNAV